MTLMPEHLGSVLTESLLKSHCDILAKQHPRFAVVLTAYGYPPLWSRPNTFESLVHIILEQQVSLASALATLEKLRVRLREITPQTILTLDDAEMKSCYVSRQKASYVRGLAQAILTGSLDLGSMEAMSSDQVRESLTSLKGIGNWTTDIYLIFVLHRTDVFPLGDLAAVNALRKLFDIPKQTDRGVLEKRIVMFSPYCTAATMLLWHYYLASRSEKNLLKQEY